MSWVRLHPIPYRLLPDGRRFKKYEIIRAPIRRSGDRRPESHNMDCDSIEKIDWISTKRGWSERNHILMPLRSECLEDLQAQPVGGQSLGLIHVRELSELEIVEQEGGWTDQQLQNLNRRSMFDRDIKTLEQPPYRFYYKFRCDRPECKGHRLQLLDWEVIQSYRSWSRIYRIDWEAKFRQRYEDDMRRKNLHLYVGTIYRRPRTWTAVGLYYPPM